MLDGNRYFAEFPDEDPKKQRKLLLSPELVMTLVAIEKEISQFIVRDTAVGSGKSARGGETGCATPLDSAQS